LPHSPRSILSSQQAKFRLDSDWVPSGDEAGALTLTLTNRSNRPLGNFRLAFTSHCQFRPEGRLRGASLVEQISGYHVIAPPAGFVVMPASSWTVTAHHLDYVPRHYTAGLKSAYLMLEDGRVAPVAVTPTTCNHEIGSPRSSEPQSTPRLPRGALPVAILPFPLEIVISDRRESPDAVRILECTREARLAFDAAAALAKRLFPSGPELLGDAGGIVCMARHEDMAEEAYRIEFTAKLVKVLASGQRGFFYGFVTLGQILQAARKEPDQFVFPLTGQIVDAPRFAWRGMLLDLARQVYQPEYLTRLLDRLAWRKLNRLHLHLSDDEGWRVDVPEYPKLAKLAGWRGHGMPIPPLLGSSADPYGTIYSRADIAQVTRRAEQLLIHIVPEIDIPGHSYGVLQAIPELRDPAETGVYRSIQNFPNNALNPAVRRTYDFLEAVFDEVARLFSSPWIHIGGDEVPGQAWRGSPLARTLMQQHGWHDAGQLQSYFLRRAQQMIRDLGRCTGAWEEAALGGGIDPRDSYLVAWHKPESGIAMAKRGYDVVLGPAEAYYLDMAQSDDWWEPGASWAGTVSPERCYAYDPGGDWPDEFKARLLGVQACLWTENLYDRCLFDHLTFPRLSAVAESAWTPAARKDFERFRVLDVFTREADAQ
jgi:hexosaminidase